MLQRVAVGVEADSARLAQAIAGEDGAIQVVVVELGRVPAAVDAGLLPGEAVVDAG